MFLLRCVRALPLLGIAALIVVTIVAVVIRFAVAELAPTESHTEQVELGRNVFLPPEWAEAWRVCGWVGVVAMGLILLTPLMRFLPDDGPRIPKPNA